MALSVRQAAKNKGKEMAAERRTQDWLAEPVQRIAQDAKSPIYILGCDTNPFSLMLLKVKWLHLQTTSHV